jgi:hypothetical protein
VPHLRWLVTIFPLLLPGFDSRPGYVGFLVDKRALEQVFSEYFGCPCQSFHGLLLTQYHPELVQ